MLCVYDLWRVILLYVSLLLVAVELVELCGWTLPALSAEDVIWVVRSSESYRRTGPPPWHQKQRVGNILYTALI